MIFLKSLFSSKTFWLATIPIIVGVLNWVEGNLVAGIPLTGYGLLAIIVRLITEGKVYLPGLKKE